METLVCLKDHPKQDEYLALHTKWENFHRTHKVHSSNRCEVIEAITCDDAFEGIHPRFKYVVVCKNVTIAYMCLDDDLEGNNTEKMIDITGFLLNPEIDWGHALRYILKLFQDFQYNGITIICDLMNHHTWLTQNLQKIYNATTLCNQHIILLKDYSNHAFTNFLTITMKGSTKHSTPATIYQTDEKYPFYHCQDIRGYGRSTTFITVLFERPLVIHYSNDYKEKNDDDFFDLIIDKKTYAICDCLNMHNSSAYCETAFWNRRLTTIQKLETSFYGYDGKLGVVIYGLKVPAKINYNLCDKCKNEYVMISNNYKHHASIHSVQYNLSMWLKTFPRTVLPAGTFPQRVTKVLLQAMECIPSHVLKTCTQHAYIYLIQEREFYESNRSIYKVGRTCQQADNIIGRLKSGYKKGSLIYGLILCSSKHVNKIELTIKRAFAKKFIKHADGTEYFIGDPWNMLDIIYDTVKSMRNATEVLENTILTNE
jgi:hypothetical protein